MTPKRRPKGDSKVQKRKRASNRKAENNAEKGKLSVNFRKRKGRGYRKKSKGSPEALKALKRSVINEYARNLQPAPSRELFQFMNHSNKARIVRGQRAGLRSSTDNYMISPTQNFYSCRKFLTNQRTGGMKSLNIEVSASSNKLDENVSRDLQGLNLRDELRTQNNNNLEIPSKSDGNSAMNLFDYPTVIEISDSSSVKDSTTLEKQSSSASESADVICIDDTPSINNDGDVIFISNKRKSVFNLGNNPKHRKSDDSVIVIDDDDDELLPKKKKKKRRNKSKAQMKRVTRSLTALNQSHHFMATSTPNKITAEAQCIKCLCVGLHGCIAKPNLATIPEEPGDKRTNNPLNPMQESLERSLLEYNNFDMLGGNFLSAGPIRTQGLRPIFIDGSNIAMGHSNGRGFSVKGLKICIDYFLKRGHEVTAVVPMFRKKPNQNSDPALLRKLEERRLVVFTPARTIKGRHIVPYDDRYLVLMAAVHQGVVVSSDNFNDLLAENSQMAETIERRVLNPTWIKDMIIFPVDPLGRNGPSLKEFLQFP